MSAKAPGRPVFASMIKRLERGEAQGILAWHPDRLARNSVDGGLIVHLLDRGVVKDLKFATFTFENNSQGKFMLSIIFGYSKYYVDTLSENVKRGNRTKVQQGWWPRKPPIGYRNDRDSRTIVIDKDRFALIRRMWDLLLTGTYNPTQIRKLATDAWGLRTLQSKRLGGKPLAHSAVYALFGNPFYAGIIEWDGQRYPGKHPAMVTIEEFQRAQRIISRPGNPQPKKRAFAYTGLIRCGRCGLTITAEIKVNRYGSRYVYYHCTKRLEPRCSERSVTEQEFEAQIEAFLDRISLPNEFYRWCQGQLGAALAREASADAVKVRNLNVEIRRLEVALSNLTDLRVRDLISDNEFTSRRADIQLQAMGLRQSLAETQNEDASPFEPLATTLWFSNQAIFLFKAGDLQTKRLILRSVGSNLVLQNRKLNIQAAEPLIELAEIRLNPFECALKDSIRTMWSDHSYQERLSAMRILKEMVKSKRLSPVTRLLASD